MNELRLVQSKRETVTSALAAIAYTAALYYVLNPEAFDRHREALSAFYEKCIHRISVRQARQAIRTLPETPEQL